MMNTTSKNGVYETSGNYTFMYISSDDYYIQGTLTSSEKARKNIASVKVNGTSIGPRLRMRYHHPVLTG